MLVVFLLNLLKAAALSAVFLTIPTQDEINMNLQDTCDM